ncbi:DUF368 domain-containing protein [Anaerobacillus alkaliphilus]|uniref:DUF368 domain-containing protein n=1 Tax=Anaerobacillus alkaliphilus TaxID=1548597 RepID=A0A4Q0VUZ1_9BACI|nr:DUF368 domain-containing protein [Anaerobacillus alkaliphilus]RXJ02099.1 DUF368 domain-containing protein [Anaerobacillus alkaliphilus]
MRNIIRGVVMGITDLIPGISGGTIAMVLGFYHELVEAINGLFSKNWRKHVLFLAPLLLGIGIALLAFSRIIEWLIANHSLPLFFFFNGLILGIIPFLLREANFKKTFRLTHYSLMVLAALLVVATGFLREEDMEVIWTNLSFVQYIYLFFAGWLASSAMILPGISGSLIFLLLGVYPTVINSISNLNISVLAIIGIGIVIGLVLTSRLIQFLFLRFSTSTFAAMIGLVLGSLIIIFPGIPQTIPYGILCVVLFFIGAFLAYMLGKSEHS